MCVSVCQCVSVCVSVCQYVSLCVSVCQYVSVLLSIMLPSKCGFVFLYKFIYTFREEIMSVTVLLLYYWRHVSEIKEPISGT